MSSGFILPPLATSSSVMIQRLIRQVMYSLQSVLGLPPVSLPGWTWKTRLGAFTLELQLPRVPFVFLLERCDLRLRGTDPHNSRLTLGYRRTGSSAEKERKSTLAFFDSPFYWLRGHSIGQCCQTTLRCTKKRQKEREREKWM